MENKLPENIQEQINTQAELYANKYLNGKVNTHEYGLLEEAWGAAATKYAQWKVKHDELKERAEKMYAALKKIEQMSDPGSYEKAVYEMKSIASEALAWKEKEVAPVKEIEYMPIHPQDAKRPGCPQKFPMHLLNENQAQSNHGQTLKRLKERGGLGVTEILSIVHGKKWSYYQDLSMKEALAMLNDLINNPY